MKKMLYFYLSYWFLLYYLSFQIDGDDKDARISLVPLQVFARDLLTILHEAGGRINLMNFETAFVDRFGKFILSWLIDLVSLP